jgi:hypothetical protein
VLKSEVNPLIGVVVVVVILVVIGVFLWRGTSGSDAKPMSVGNPGPFAPGGAAAGKGGAPVTSGPPGTRPAGLPTAPGP